MNRIRDAALRVAAKFHVRQPIETWIPEITPAQPRPGIRRGRRLNLLLPSINPEHYFGGTHTALEIFRSLSSRFPQSRIVLTDSRPRVEARRDYPNHAFREADSDDDAPHQIVPFNDRHRRTLPVSPADCWLATAWWTAYIGQGFARWQAERFDVADRIGYLIQDFEPGFYPWSSQYAIAFETYRPHKDVALFNTSTLRDYFAGQGLRFERAAVFEPTLNAALIPALQRARDAAAPRRRQILVYGRPSTPRNGFSLICEGLRLWASVDSRAAAWRVVSVGEQMDNVDLGACRMTVLGKLSLDAYARALADSAVGIALMISPHPSYPPLEMAAFGMRVVTNRYGTKELERDFRNLRSLSQMTPTGIANAISVECDACERAGMIGAPLFDESHPFMAPTDFTDLSATVDSWLEHPGTEHT
jgi:hypothetical protein